MNIIHKCEVCSGRFKTFEELNEFYRKETEGCFITQDMTYCEFCGRGFVGRMGVTPYYFGTGEELKEIIRYQISKYKEAISKGEEYEI